MEFRIANTFTDSLTWLTSLVALFYSVFDLA
jgi:hypothetical protein